MTRAGVRVVDGQLVLDDPDALAMTDAVARANCRATLATHGERILHFRHRVRALGRTADTTLIVVINADQPMGPQLAEACGMPAGWADSFRAQGVTPYARGLVDREGMQSLLDHLGVAAATQLRETAGLPGLVLDHGTITIFDLGLLGE